MEKNKYTLLTLEQARECISANPEMTFYETKHVVDGYNISIFNYKLCWYENFIAPIAGKPEIDAYEMRGLTFVFNPDGSIYKRYLMLNKFWNVNQVSDTQYENIKNLEVVQVTTKEDGSLISFVQLPNKTVVPRTKASFSSDDQLMFVREIYNSDVNLQKLLSDCFDNDIVLFFEYVSFNNKVVLEYTKQKLVLIKARDNKTGEYIDIYQFANYGVELVKTVGITLEEAMSMKETATGIEGWVFQFSNDLMVKLKTKEYFELHSLLTNDINREDYIISMVCDETIDDVISQIPDYHEAKKEFIRGIERKVLKYLSDKYHETHLLAQTFNGDMKTFAIENHKKNPVIFNFANAMIKGEDVLAAIKTHLKKITFRLSEARAFLNSLD